MLCSESLAKMKPFNMLPESRLDWICDRAEAIRQAILKADAGDGIVIAG